MSDIQQPITELTEAYRQGHLSETTFRTALLGLNTEQIAQAINTQGGPAFLGDVKVDRGGKLVVGDDYSVTTTIITNPEQYSPEDLLTFYYRALANECRRLPLGVIDTQFIRTSGDQPVPLPDIYVDQDFPGGGYVFAPNGRCIYATPAGSPGAVYVELDLNELTCRDC